MKDELLGRAAKLLRPVPDFPEPGILFFDLNPLLRDMEVMRHITKEIGDYWGPAGVDVVAGLDSRGFLFGPMVAEYLNVPFTMVRKKGKLPPPTKSIAYSLEYGQAEIEMSDDQFLADKKVLLIDDLLATGGTVKASAELIRLLGGYPIGVACVTELPELGGRGKVLELPVQSLITIMDGQALVGVEYCVDMLVRPASNDSLLLVERLGEVKGTAMPGGRIEKRESVITAAMRELQEETNAIAQAIKYLGVLTGIDRDPRGPKVSVVVDTIAEVEKLIGEPKNTKPFWVPSLEQLPHVSEFVFGHGPFVHEHWRN